MYDKAVLMTIIVSLIRCGLGQTCNEDNCKLPDCRCFDQKDIPGGLTIDETPMIITVTSEDAFNAQLADFYASLFTIVNPNGCNVRGAWFLKHRFTDYSLVKIFYDQGQEFAVQSINGSAARDVATCNTIVQTVISALKEAGLNETLIEGLRAANLEFDGDILFQCLEDNNMLYDSSCTSVKYSQEGSTQWPFTYDYLPGPVCDNGKGPSKPCKGKWEFMVSGLEWNGAPCATAAACVGINTQQDAFNLFLNAFEKHYKTNKAPFNMVVDPVWLSADHKREGTVEFLDYARAAFSDVWIVTMTQALDWIRNPTSLQNITSFPPWKC